MSRLIGMLARLLPVLLLFTALPAQAQEKRIALTFDDVPRSRGPFLAPEERTEKLIAALQEAGVKQAAFFVNPGHIGTGDGVNGVAHIEAYVRAGHVIGDHSFTHPHLSALSVAAYTAEIDKAEAWLKGRPGYRPWFRYPFLDEGGTDKAKRDAIRAVLKARGLQDGYVTASGSDWNTEDQLIAAKKAGKAIDMEALRKFYIATHLEAADFADALMVKTIGRSPIHVMLMHETDLAALFLPDLVKALRADGWEIVPADEAYADPIHSAQPDTPSADGTLAELLAREKHVDPPYADPRGNLTFVNRLFAERVLHESTR
ncbi:polysaccharide deacetylase family protein [Sphingomonas sp. dw_22]|uniref:polysaccharide deacetylase family protein n=1 Tax=Sphingomonas sp. dw_22 TaxID=2721175 RepID=UPI00211702C6|nr:polysaccharide deacetylase family protein [Sphingomonas sp. dw_22]